MSKHRYNIWLRLHSCWRLLTAKSWLFYTPDGADAYRVGWQGVARTDLQSLRQWCNDREGELNGQNEVLATILNLNPGIAPAPNQ